MNPIGAAAIIFWMFLVELRLAGLISGLDKLRQGNPMLRLRSESRVLNISEAQKNELMKLIDKFGDEEEEEDDE